MWHHFSAENPVVKFLHDSMNLGKAVDDKCSTHTKLQDVTGKFGMYYTF